jgi:hypothetical protein
MSAFAGPRRAFSFEMLADGGEEVIGQVALLE